MIIPELWRHPSGHNEILHKGNTYVPDRYLIGPLCTNISTSICYCLLLSKAAALGGRQRVARHAAEGRRQAPRYVVDATVLFATYIIIVWVLFYLLETIVMMV